MKLKTDLNRKQSSGSQGQREEMRKFGGDGVVLYLECGGGCMVVYTC